ncbi:hypothetical protein [Bradyrhizobium sp.]|jgi:hypothetical protein|uniref:hypothetical protein n=1 Tax=Bradyrhizobium sp. TaxID=376 RepID=UPI0025BCFDF0|nr:hypothetical protein [Bradyrhizobium sp.]
MPRENSNDWNRRQRALSRWDNEGGAGPDGPATVSAPDNARIEVSELTNAELVTLRIRVGEHCRGVVKDCLHQFN